MSGQNDKPLISVVMPAYNAEKFIRAAVASVRAQSYENWELLIIDDGSKDRTVEIAEKMTMQDSRIFLFCNENNMGVAKTRNRGIALARGEYIALLDSDDLWMPEKLEKQFALAQKEDAQIVYCSYAMIDEQGSKKHEPFIVPLKTDYKKMLISSVISCSTVLLQAQTAKAYSFDETYYHEDYVLWMQLLKDGKRAVGNADVLASYRIRETSRSSDKLSSAKKRWVIYRKCLHMSLIPSAYYLFRYALRAVRKYS